MRAWLNDIRELGPAELAVFALCLLLWVPCVLIELAAAAVAVPCFWLADRHRGA